MIAIRRSSERGRTSLGWLDSRHSFSFGGYHDRNFMNFHALRVINEDVVQPERGFAKHHHEDMEILTYVLSGALRHRDSLGNGGIIRPGDAQRMSAGTGIQHSEFNESTDEIVHLLQIWILPDQKGLPPSYEQKSFRDRLQPGRLLCIAARDGRDGAVTIHQDVSLYVARLAAGNQIEHSLAAGRYAWLQVARGSMKVNGKALQQGDAAALSGENAARLSSNEESEALLFDLA